jgi:hypothetical protein
MFLNQVQMRQKTHVRTIRSTEHTLKEETQSGRHIQEDKRKHT